MLPSTPTVANLLIAFVTAFQGMTVGASWVDSGITITDANSGENKILYRYVLPGDTTTFSFGTPGNGAFWEASVVEVDGVTGNWGTDLGTAQTGTQASGTNPFNTTSFNSLRDDALALAFEECPQASAPTSFGGTWTLEASDSGGGYGGGVASKAIPVAGSAVQAAITQTRSFTAAYIVLTIEPVAEPDPHPRVSQLARITLFAFQADARVSQVARVTLASFEANARVSQLARITLASYSPCHTRRAQLWKIARTDGVVKCYTSHDQPINFGPHTYSPCDSLNPSASESNATIEGVANMELSGIISDDGVSEDDVIAGKYDDAYVEVFLVAWADVPDEAVSVDSVYRLAAGWVGEQSAGTAGWKTEVLGPGAKLAQKTILQTYAPTCRWRFGDSNCGIDIEAMKVEGVVDVVSDQGLFTVTIIATPTGDALFENGFVRFLDGDNIGTECEVKTVQFVGLGATVTLWAAAPFLPSSGDAIEILPGCGNTKADCQFYDNFEEFGGFPDVPGNDEIAQTPESKI